MRNPFILAILALVLVSCGPQAAFFQVDAQDMQGVTVAMDNKQVAVFSLVPQSKADSIRSGNAAMALATKLEQDRGFYNPLPVFSLPLLDFAGFGETGYDRGYLRNLMLSTGADLQIFVHSLRFGQPGTHNTGGYFGEYDEKILSLPYSVGMDVYDALEDTLVMRRAMRDTVYISVIAQNDRNGYGDVIASKLPDVCRIVGESLGTELTRQWHRQERMLVNYPDNDAWEKPLAKALDFRWSEAIALWMPLTGSKNARVAAFAAYNIAVGCEMLGQFPLAREWAEFSVKKFRFRENGMLVAHLKEK